MVLRIQSNFNSSFILGMPVSARSVSMALLRQGTCEIVQDRNDAYCYKNIPPILIRQHLYESHNFSFFNSIVQCKNVLHPRCLASARQPAKVDGSMYPLLASAGIPGFPITSLESGIPAFAIWKRADPVDEDVKRLLQVVYSLVPSAHVLLFSNLFSRRPCHIRL